MTLTKKLIIGFVLLSLIPNGIKSQSVNSIKKSMVVDTSGIFMLDQVGYMPKSYKVALIKANVGDFEVIDSKSNKVVFIGKTGSPQYWKFSGDTVRMADFTQLITPGKYRLYLKEKSIYSYAFEIKPDVYSEVTKAAIKAFYFNRCSFEITKEFGGKWARAAGHPDTEVIVDESAASKERPAGTKISSPGGWYDAGDYNKYIVNSGITMYTLLLFYQMHPEYCNQLNTNIPESNNNIPDVVDEILFNLNWMLTMQDPNDGGVYHKLTNKSFDAFIMPDKAIAPRYVVMKCTPATLDFAAVMAIASRVFANSHNAKLETLAITFKEAANKAYAWAKANPAVYYKQPAGFQTGYYGDRNLSDEFLWANAEMALLNQDNSLITQKDIEARKLSVPGWPQVDFLGLISLSLTNNEQFKDLKNSARQKIVALADSLTSISNSCPYNVSLKIFNWGSNGELANEVFIQLIAYNLTKDKKYLSAIQGNVDYILGKNATGYCFVTGFGSKQVMNIHHRISGSDGIPEPEPGFLCGGPNPSGQNDCGPDLYPSKFPAKSYLDALCSYASNEIAINWNAPLFFILGSMDAMGEKK